MCYGCRQRAINYASNDDFINKCRTIAKNMAMDDGVWYVIVKQNNGVFSWMSEAVAVKDSSVSIVEYASPM